MASKAVTLKSLRALAASGRSEKLNAAIVAGFQTDNVKLQKLAIALAAELGITLPLGELIAVARQPATQLEAEQLGAALRLHRDDAAITTMVKLVGAMSDNEWTSSLAAVGYALRSVANPRATDLLIDLVRESSGACRQRALFALRGRRPRDVRAAALAREVEGLDGTLLRLGQADPDTLFDLVDEALAGRVPPTAFTLRQDVVVAWLSSLAMRALGKDAAARARVIEVADSGKMSIFRPLWKEDLVSPPLIALVEGGDPALVEATLSIATWLPLEGRGCARLIDIALARVGRGEVLHRELGHMLHQTRHPAAVPILVDVLATRDAAQADSASWALEGRQPRAATLAALDDALSRTLEAPERARVQSIRDKLADQLPVDAFESALESHAVDEIQDALTNGADANQVFDDDANVRPLHLLLRRWSIDETDAVVAATRMLVAAGADVTAKLTGRVSFQHEGGDKFAKGDTPATLAMGNTHSLSRGAIDRVIEAMGLHPTDAYLATV